jgi:hypothetical protein
MNINYLAVIVAAIINMAVGAAWYSSALFAKSWSKATGRSMEEMGSAKSGYLISTIGSLLIAWVLADFAHKLGLTSLASGLGLGFLAWIGFVVPTYASSYVFEGRPQKLYNINVGYYLVSFLLMGAIVTAWH